MSRGFWVAAISMAFSVSLFANTTAQDFPKLKNYAKSLGAQPLNTMNQFHPETTFKNYNDKPDQERYYSGVETENIDLNVPAMNALKNDAGGQTVHDNFGKRQFEINKNNSAIQNAKLIEDESYAITHGISTARIKCDEKPKDCEIKTHEETCHTSRQLPDQQCVKKRRVSVDSEHINQRLDVEVVISKKWTGVVTVNLVTGAIGNAAGGHVSNPLRFTHACEGMTATIHSIRNNGASAYWVGVIGMPSCSNNGLLTLAITKEWGRFYPIQIALTVNASSKPYVSEEHWDNTCSTLERLNSCHIKDTHCTDSNANRVINGLPVARDCWETTETFACRTTQTDECTAQKTKGCLQISSRCSAMDNNACALYEQVYNCQEKVCPAPVACVKDLFCADGDCTDHATTANDNFGKSVSALAVAGEAGHEFSQTQSTLFAGRAQSCEVFGLDFLDCCASKGWGEKLNLAHCSGPEKELGKAKLNYLVYYIGEYCAKEWPWPINGCEIRKNTYCIFGSKLARIVQEQGRLKQLNNAAFGTPEHPNCSGMSVAELQQIQMDKIDFVTPIYPYSVNDRDIGGKPTPKAGIAGDMNLNQPNSGQTIDEIKRRVQQRAGQ